MEQKVEEEWAVQLQLALQHLSRHFAHHAIETVETTVALDGIAKNTRKRLNLTKLHKQDAPI